MLLPLTTTSLPSTAGPPQGLKSSFLLQRILPSLTLRQYSERSPTLSCGKYAEPASTLSPTTVTGASTCHFSSPLRQSCFGSACGSWSSVGGTANLLVILSFS